MQPHLEDTASLFWLQAIDPEQGLVPSVPGVRLLVAAPEVSEHRFAVGLLCRPGSVPGPCGIPLERSIAARSSVLLLLLLCTTAQYLRIGCHVTTSAVCRTPY